jgi:hypothetical protein
MMKHEISETSMKSLLDKRIIVAIGQLIYTTLNFQSINAGTLPEKGNPLLWYCREL